MPTNICISKNITLAALSLCPWEPHQAHRPGLVLLFCETVTATVQPASGLFFNLIMPRDVLSCDFEGIIWHPSWFHDNSW
jgi:hypothetical protein